MVLHIKSPALASLLRPEDYAHLLYTVYVVCIYVVYMCNTGRSVGWQSSADRQLRGKKLFLNLDSSLEEVHITPSWVQEGKQTVCSESLVMDISETVLPVDVSNSRT